jgi:hypothetical protein
MVAASGDATAAGRSSGWGNDEVVKIQISGKVGHHGYPHYRRMSSLPLELRGKIDSTTWAAFWVDVSGKHSRYEALLNGLVLLFLAGFCACFFGTAFGSDNNNNSNDDDRGDNHDDSSRSLSVGPIVFLGWLVILANLSGFIHHSFRTGLEDVCHKYQEDWKRQGFQVSVHPENPVIPSSNLFGRNEILWVAHFVRMDPSSGSGGGGGTSRSDDHPTTTTPTTTTINVKIEICAFGGDSNSRILNDNGYPHYRTMRSLPLELQQQQQQQGEGRQGMDPNTWAAFWVDVSGTQGRYNAAMYWLEVLAIVGIFFVTFLLPVVILNSIRSDGTMGDGDGGAVEYREEYYWSSGYPQLSVVCLVVMYTMIRSGAHSSFRARLEEVCQKHQPNMKRQGIKVTIYEEIPCNLYIFTFARTEWIWVAHFVSILDTTSDTVNGVTATAAAAANTIPITSDDQGVVAVELATTTTKSHCYAPPQLV